MAEEDQTPSVHWDSNIDTLLAGWCDNAKCFEWMHTEAYSFYEKRAQTFMISINVLTAISGVSNLIAGGITVGTFQIAWLFGSVSIFVSTLNIIQDKLAYQQSGIIHKKLASSWANIRTRIEEVITLPYSARRDCKTFLKYIKADINQATMEGNTMIPEKIRIDSYNRFKTIESFDMPDICGGIQHTKIFLNDTEKPLLA
jgi:hypothetical protein